MRLNEFEKALADLFSEKGWGTMNDDWFSVEIISKYKHKIVRVIRADSRVIFRSEGEKFHTCFFDIIDQIKAEHDG